MTIIDDAILIISLPASIFWTISSNMILLPIFLTWIVFRQIYQMIENIFNKMKKMFLNCLSVLMRIFVFLRKYIKNNVNYYIYSLQEPQRVVRPLFRSNTAERQVQVIRQTAAANPHEITENQKVLMLMQKMRKLQEIIFQESVDRRKAEGQLFQLKVNYQQRNAQLIKERSQCVENLNKINMLKMEISQKNDDLIKSRAKVQELENVVKQLKKELFELQQKDQGQKQENDQTTNRQSIQGSQIEQKQEKQQKQFQN